MPLFKFCDMGVLNMGMTRVYIPLFAYMHAASQATVDPISRSDSEVMLYSNLSPIGVTWLAIEQFDRRCEFEYGIGWRLSQLPRTCAYNLIMPHRAIC